VIRPFAASTISHVLLFDASPTAMKIFRPFGVIAMLSTPVG
jgi:hypothetical protein